jgi:type IV pilus assembly protein PilA
MGLPVHVIKTPKNSGARAGDSSTQPCSSPRATPAGPAEKIIVQNKQTFHPAQKGFTLIELMITVAIIGILAAVAIPTYRDYITKAKISEALLAATPCRTGVVEAYQTAPGPPEPGVDMFSCNFINLDDPWGLQKQSPMKYVTSVGADGDGIIVIYTSRSDDLPEDARYRAIRLVPLKADGSFLRASDMPSHVFAFKCEPYPNVFAMPQKYMPGSCK